MTAAAKSLSWITYPRVIQVTTCLNIQGWRWGLSVGEQQHYAVSHSAGVTHHWECWQSSSHPPPSQIRKSDRDLFAYVMPRAIQLKLLSAWTAKWVFVHVCSAFHPRNILSHLRRTERRRGVGVIVLGLGMERLQFKSPLCNEEYQMTLPETLSLSITRLTELSQGLMGREVTCTPSWTPCRKDRIQMQ